MRTLPADRCSCLKAILCFTVVRSGNEFFVQPQRWCFLHYRNGLSPREYVFLHPREINRRRLIDARTPWRATTLPAAAGPKGRDAETDTDVTLRSEVLTYSRSRGLFAGVSLEGSTLRPDNAANQDVYGKKIDAMAIVRKNAAPVPKAAQKLIALLDKHSRKNESDPNSLK